MGEMMGFPATPEDFIRQFSFRDKKEVYTNGSELIPVFRVEQMIEYYFKGGGEKNGSRHTWNRI